MLSELIDSGILPVFLFVIMCLCGFIYFLKLDYETEKPLLELKLWLYKYKEQNLNDKRQLKKDKRKERRFKSLGIEENDKLNLNKTK